MDPKKLKWIMSYNDRRIGMKEGAVKETEGNNMEEDEPLHRYHRQSYPSEIFQTLEEMKMESILTDLILSTEDGLSLHVHSLVMAAVSSVIQQKLRERDGDEKEILLRLGPEVNGSGLAAVVELAYTGVITSLNKDNITQIQTAAVSLGAQRVMELFLEQEMDIHNCLDVASFAEAYGMADLLELAEDFVLRRFQEISATPKFQDLPAEKLLQFLRCDALSTPSELAVFRAVVTWVEADPTERLPQAEELMRAVRFPFMTFREFREVRAVNLSMECSGEVEVELYKSALKEFGFGISDRVVRQRVRHPKDALVLVGGDELQPDMGQRLPSKQLWFANSLRSGTGLVKEIEWRLLGEMPDQARFRHGVGVLDGQLYVAGGCHFYAKSDTMKSVYRYDPEKNHWKRLADLHELRSNFMLVVSGDSLYAVGGDKDINTNLDSVEKYSPETDTWSFCHPLDQALSGHAATVWGGEIFISGGFNCKYECLVSMFLYHPERGTTYLAEMTHDRAQHCMESLNNRFYVAGGVCNLRKYYTDQLVCEMYNPVSDIWTVFTPLPIPHVGAASAILEERLYILGGYCQEDYNNVNIDEADMYIQSIKSTPANVTDKEHILTVDQLLWPNG
uniref:Si:ch211-63p21.8 n=1 Tax=Cyprinus carpio TaxID=7962 RepID=A0A8C1PFR9_CYPCA